MIIFKLKYCDIYKIRYIYHSMVNKLCLCFDLKSDWVLPTEQTLFYHRPSNDIRFSIP